MTVGVLSLAEFLLARIAEDEAWAKRGVRLPPDGNPDDPARVLAECEAKRRIVEEFADAVDAGFEDWDRGVDARRTLGHLAAVYSEHPDYRDEWKP